MQISSAFNRSVHLQQALSLSSNTGVWRTMRTIVQKDSISGLWRGILPTFVRNTLGVGLYFVTLSSLNDLISRHEGNTDGPISNRAALFAGAFSRSFAVCLLCPLSVVKTRMETVEYSTKYTGMVHALGNIGKNEGFRGLFSGLVPAIVRDAPYSALYMLIYLRSKAYVGNAFGIESRSNIAGASKIERKESDKSKLMAVNFTCGAIGGALATLLTQPQDVIKTRMQLTQRHLAGANRYGTVREAARRIFLEEGAYGFFRGSSARVLKRMLGSAVTWMVYEEMVTIYMKVLDTEKEISEGKDDGAILEEKKNR